MNQVTNANLVYYQFAQWVNMKHGIFTRKGGVSAAPWNALNLGGNVGDDPAAVRHNHDLIYRELDLNAKQTCTVWQVHSADVIIANGPVQGRRWMALADSMVTDKPDTPLFMRFADCTPILFHDPVRRVIGIAHGGWRGTVQGVAANTVRAMVEGYGCKPEDVQAGIGPAIGPDSYQVGEEVVRAVQDYFGTTDNLIRRDPNDGSAYLNLWEANRLDLERAGVRQIEIAGICTATHTDEFFSHRAEKGRTGRFGAVLSL
ncbi:MAG: peptidoglycan editing factor PgeF [Chloroflexi bacterium]|nr:peptidoglycan editing factor PgeF [Chloroflexota bacterium]MCC6896986.1 peptidoglycan editing factor PgeF [Anaerolineae bacterium]